ncbi:MAG: insulinase family protein [Candidatus Aminicenantes bacterium]|nr:insulinase family protein [Candidatus Aminicenantes bacterium]
MNLRSAQMKLPNLLSFVAGIIIFSPILALTTNRTLSNGLQLIIEQNSYGQTTAVFILIQGGKLADPPGKAGLGYLVTRLCLDPPDNDFLKNFMKNGADIRIAAKGDFLLISIECLSSDFENIMKLIFRTFSQPIFSSLRIGNLKENLKSNQKKERDDVDSQADLTLLETFFGASGYGASGYGTPVSVESFKGEDATNYHRKYFVGANMIMSVVSNLDPDLIISIIESTFGRLPRGESCQIPSPKPIVPDKKEICLTKETPSAFIAAVFPLPEPTTKNYLLSHFLQIILGQGPSSKMWSLRTEAGLAYETGSRLILMKGGGLLILYLKTMADKFSEAKEKFDLKLKEVAEKGIKGDDLEKARESYRLSLYKQSESKIKRAETLAIHQIFGLEKIETHLENITFAELEAFFKNVFNLEKSVFFQIIPSRGNLINEKSGSE